MDEKPPETTPGTTLASTGTSDHDDRHELYEFARQMVEDATAELHAATDTAWQFVAEESIHLSDNAARRPSQFLDDAMDRIVEGPYDIIVVATDVSLLSRTRRSVPGLASTVSRVVVVSTYKLVTGPREKPVRPLDAPAVRWNAGALLLHLLGHVPGAGHGEADGGVMEPFEFDRMRRDTPNFDADTEAYLHRIAREIPETSLSRGRLGRLAFHARTAVRNPGQIIASLRNSQPFRFPLPPETVDNRSHADADNHFQRGVVGRHTPSFEREYDTVCRCECSRCRSARDVRPEPLFSATAAASYH